MAGLVVMRPGADWTATGGLFDWVLEFLIDRVSDPDAVERLREVLDNNLGSLWVPDFAEAAQREIIGRLAEELNGAAQRELPEGEHKAAAVHHLGELSSLAASQRSARG
jgi:hypothetical protein